ncbi:MAG: type II toxin-antitoxin system PemK/MazF family toxin [Bacilli bacterium]|nr:type II toxin-antitoxin system PemK/MazF family toxin [Bacilli bacterium]
MVKYIPKQGDIVYLDFSSTKGHEQKGKRPAIVISNNIFNINTNMAVMCPITSNTKDFPTHYVLEDTKKIKGSVLCEHIRSIDYENRNIKFVEKASDNDMLSVMMLMNACIED